MAARTIALITGGNNGIGYETVKSLLQSKRPYHLLVGSRSPEKGKLAIEKLHEECPNATNTMELLQVDLTSDESIEKAFEQVKYKQGRVDVLINNAGATFDIAFLANQVSLRECFTKSYNVNVAGTNVLTWTFMPLLLLSSAPRLIFVAGLANITQASQSFFPTPAQPAGWPKNIDFETIGYRCSKLALNMLMVDWDWKLRADGVKVFGVGPGFLATNLGGDRERIVAMGGGHASIGGEMLRSVVEGERDGETGRVVLKEGVAVW